MGTIETQYTIQVTATERTRMDVTVVEVQTGRHIVIEDMPYNGSINMSILRIFLRMRERVDDLARLNQFMGYEEARHVRTDSE